MAIFSLPKDSTITINKTHKCHNGILGYFQHQSTITKTQMAFTLFIPNLNFNQTSSKPLLTFLSGLTCTEDNFTTKANAYAKAAELGFAVLAPDTSPRGANVADKDAYDLGQGAGFYINATQEPWRTHYQMESYIIDELIPLVESSFYIGGQGARGIFGHSMGGHGALTFYFKYPDFFNTCSAFAPIVSPSTTPWGLKAFEEYLGQDQSVYAQHDACKLVLQAKNAGKKAPILIDQGLGDDFLKKELQPALFEAACQKSGQKLELRLHEGYDHSYFFIQSFINDHIAWHFNLLNKSRAET